MAKINQAMQDLLRYNAAMMPQKRSTFDKSHSHLTTFDSAYLVPLMWDRVLPGDEKQIRYSGLARMATPLHPTMDQANLDVWCFFVPDRLWWDHAKEFYGENLDASFNPDGEYVMPYLTPAHYAVNVSVEERGKVGIQSLNDYFGFPTFTSVADRMRNAVELRATAGLHRSYQLIWNDWFRNTSIQPALRLNKGDTVTDEEWAELHQIRKVCKYPDMFTSLLKEPQAGDDVTLPLGEWAPVVGRSGPVSSVPGLVNYPLRVNVNAPGPTDIGSLTLGVNNGLAGSDSNLEVKAEALGGLFNEHSYRVYASNLWADLSTASAVTINNLRAAVTVQQLLEVDATAGKFYQRILQAHFGVFTPDATLQRPELLGATRTPIGMRQVLQTSASQPGTNITPQGNTAAFSLTNVANEWICNKAFTEPGFIMVLGAVRVSHSYSQGLDPLLTKLNRYDHYYPVFDHLGNQPVPKSAIFCSVNNAFYKAVNGSGSATNNPDDFTSVLGYQEAWTEYRMRPNRVSGLMRPDLPGGTYSGKSIEAGLDGWNYAIAFDRPPVLNTNFVTEDEYLIDRTIAVQDEPQFILDSYFDYKDTKNMSVHSVPGLLRL